MAYDFIGIGEGTGYAELGLKVSEQVLPKLFADVAYLKGYMVDGRYEAEGQNFASIVIPTLRRPTGKFVSMKSSYNPYTTATRDRTFQDHLQLDIDREYNEPIDLPEAMVVQNVIGGQLAGKMAEYVAKNIAEEINFITADAMHSAVIYYSDDRPLNKRKIEYVDFASTTDTAPNAIAKLKAKIGNADPLGWTNPTTNEVIPGDTSFNGVPMSAVISNTFEAGLLSNKGQFILESSYGQEILVEGTFGRITLSDNQNYRGKIQGVNMFVLPDNFFPAEDSVEGRFENTPSAGRVYGIMGVAEATYRVFVDKGIKISDATLYRGWILQPLYRLGIKVAKPWGVGLLVSKDYVAPNLQVAKAEIATFEASSASGKTKVATLKGGAAYAYRTGNYDDVPANKVLLAADGWTALAVGDELAVSADDNVVVVALDKALSSAEAKGLAKEIHTFTSEEIG